MLISFSEFRDRLKSLDLPVYRDRAPNDTSYPYYVYSYTNEDKVTASGVHQVYLPEYQISLFTTGTEKELVTFKKKFSDVPYQTFSSQQGDENNDLVTNFYTFIRVKSDE